jgi:hypothetical protein
MDRRDGKALSPLAVVRILGYVDATCPTAPAAAVSVREQATSITAR